MYITKLEVESINILGEKCWERGGFYGINLVQLFVPLAFGCLQLLLDSI